MNDWETPNMNPRKLEVSDPGYEGLIGIARRDITPPAGIYCRNWGAGKQGAAKGVHRPLTLTVLTFQQDETSKPLVLLAVDLGWFGSDEDEWAVRGPVVQTFGLDQSQVILNLSHTHSAPAPVTARVNGEANGAELLGPFLSKIGRDSVSAVRECLANRRPSSLAWTYGRCDLARNRDLVVEADSTTYPCGFNPYGKHDDTLLVGRVTDESDRIIAIVVNYACHPTTLGWANTLVSPDFVGATREVVETIFEAPCMFLNGAAGELAPREQYVADVSVADRHGEKLGYAVASTLKGMLPPRQRYVYDRTVPSGAPLGVWELGAMTLPRDIQARQTVIDIPLKSDFPSIHEIEKQLDDCHDPILYDLLRRKRLIRKTLGTGMTTPGAMWIWKIGDTFFIANKYESYSWIQTELRRRFAPIPIVWMNESNGGFIGYLPPRSAYVTPSYQVKQSPFAPGCLELVCDCCEHTMRSMLGRSIGEIEDGTVVPSPHFSTAAAASDHEKELV